MEAGSRSLLAAAIAERLRTGPVLPPGQPAALNGNAQSADRQRHVRRHWTRSRLLQWISRQLGLPQPCGLSAAALPTPPRRRPPPAPSPPRGGCVCRFLAPRGPRTQKMGGERGGGGGGGEGSLA